MQMVPQAKLGSVKDNYFYGSVTITTYNSTNVCITIDQPDTKSNPNPNHTTKQHAIVNIKLK